MERIERLPGAVIVQIHDRPCITAENHERVKNLLCHAGQNTPRLIIDCREVTWITAKFLSALLITMKRLSARPGDIVLCQVTPLVRTVFEVTHLDHLFPIVATREDALAVEGPASIPLFRG